jgi:hypothetical protein
MHGCEILFTADEATQVRRELARAMGENSPCVGCAEGRRCPLLPDDLTPVLDTPARAFC